jgi:hypothetical protein
MIEAPGKKIGAELFPSSRVYFYSVYPSPKGNGRNKGLVYITEQDNEAD